ncbi:MAG: hypothetical protein DCC68_01100 [Planctomycetota bacterium]|nr:MAG: hypothetical protein DCC68_01100 [Planctomycetota bacterium]
MRLASLSRIVSQLHSRKRPRPRRARRRLSMLESLETRLALDGVNDDGATDGSSSSGGTTTPDPNEYDLALVVSTTVDEVDGDHSDGDLSLREAIIMANAHLGNTSISLPAGRYAFSIAPAVGDQEDYEYQGLRGDLDVAFGGRAIQIIGEGLESTIIDARGLDRVFDLNQSRGALSLSGLTIRGGNAGSGGGIYNGEGTLRLADVVIEDSFAKNSGGAFLIGESGQLFMDRTIIRDNVATLGGGAWFEEKSVSIVRDSLISQNRAFEEGGGFRLREAFVEVYNSTFSENWAGADGGAAASLTSTLRLENSVVQDNFAANRGGGIYSLSGLTLASVLVTGNATSTNGQGGGVYTNGADIADSTIAGNSAGSGGGIALGWGAGTTIADTSITGNSAETAGGGLFTSNLATSLPSAYRNTLDNVRLIGNTATFGAGLCNGNNQSLGLTNSLIADNTATQQGGGAINDGGYLRLGGTVVRSNRVATIGEAELFAPLIGGGILNDASAADATLILDASEVRDNEIEVEGWKSIHAYGGGVANWIAPTGGFHTATLTIRDSAITGNSVLARHAYLPLADDHTVFVLGGGVFSSAESQGATAEVRIERSSLVDNRVEAIANSPSTFYDVSVDAAGGGGYTGFNSRMTLDDTTVERNSVRAVDLQEPGEGAEAFGGGLASRRSGSELVVSGSTVRENEVSAESESAPISFGGGVYSQNPTLSINDSIVTENSAGANGSGGGLYVTGATIGGSTIAANSAATGGGITVDGGVSVEISGTSLSGNAASVAGGGLITTNLTTPVSPEPSITLDNVQLVGNTAAFGAGLCNGNNQSLGLTNSLIADNTAIQQGGGAINDGGYLRLENSEIRGNRVIVEQGANVTAIGGGILNRSLAGVAAAVATLVLEGVDVIDNEVRAAGDDFANAYGAGIGVLAVASDGGGKAAFAETFLRNSRIMDNTVWAKTAETSIVPEPTSKAYGGGLYGSSRGSTATADVHIVNSTFDGNSAIATADESLNFDGGPFAIGGGMYFDAAGSLTVVGSTVSSNLALSEMPFDDNANAMAGGIAFASASSNSVLSVIQSTISGNLARARSADDAVANGGGIVIGLPYDTRFQGRAEIVSSTIAYNRVSAEAPDNVTAQASGIDVFSNPGSATFYQSLVAANVAEQTKIGLPGGEQTNTPAGRSTRGGNLLAGFNLIVEQEATAWLGKLALNGGTTQTHALLPGSPAIDAADPAFDPNVFTPPLSTDQRGQPRVVDGNADGTPRIDIGAFEYSASFLFGDLNGDGQVGLGDLAVLQRSFGATGASYAAGDLNADGRVDRADIGVLASHFGSRSTPIAPPSAAAVVARAATRTMAPARSDCARTDEARPTVREARRRAIAAESVDRVLTGSAAESDGVLTTAKLRARRTRV